MNLNDTCLNYGNLEINVRERILFTGISVGIRVVDLSVSEVTISFRKRSRKVCCFERHS